MFLQYFYNLTLANFSVFSNFRLRALKPPKHLWNKQVFFFIKGVLCPTTNGGSSWIENSTQPCCKKSTKPALPTEMLPLASRNSARSTSMSMSTTILASRKSSERMQIETWQQASWMRFLNWKVPTAYVVWISLILRFPADRSSKALHRIWWPWTRTNLRAPEYGFYRASDVRFLSWIQWL